MRGAFGAQPAFSGSEAADLHAGGLCCCRQRVGVVRIWVFRPTFAGVEGGEMGCEKEREIRKAESLPWLRNDGARCSIAMPRRGEAEGHRGLKTESSGGREKPREERELRPSYLPSLLSFWVGFLFGFWNGFLLG